MEISELWFRLEALFPMFTESCKTESPNVSVLTRQNRHKTVFRWFSRQLPVEISSKQKMSRTGGTIFGRTTQDLNNFYRDL